MPSRYHALTHPCSPDLSNTDNRLKNKDTVPEIDGNKCDEEKYFEGKIFGL